MCQGRAVADGRLSPDHYRDAVASLLLTPDERISVERARDDTPPADVRARLEWERLRACAQGMVPRTVVIDGAIRSAGADQLVIVGAGLDTRPWRMTELADTLVFSVDHPASQADCRSRVGELPAVAARLEFVPVDLGTHPLARSLGSAGHDPMRRSTWVWEGVVPYLTRDQVEETLAAIAGCSAPGSTLVVQYQDRSALARVGRRVSAFAARRTGLDDPLADEPWRSMWTPTSMADLLGRHRFGVESDESLLDIATRIGAPISHRRSLANGRVAIATRA